VPLTTFGSAHSGLRFARCFARFAPPCASRKTSRPKAKTPSFGGVGEVASRKPSRPKAKTHKKAPYRPSFHFSFSTFRFSLSFFHFSFFTFLFSLFVFHFSFSTFHFSLFTFHFSLFTYSALAACRGEACEAPSEAKPVRERPL
jgi:hypothetical protein